MRISVVICTKNEEKNIVRCLKAVQSVADEIVIVDSFSTDQTEALCKTFPKVRFQQVSWKGFSETKNYANSLASGDYILSLDADEELSIEIQKEIVALKGDLKGLYSINRLTNYCGQWIRYSGWFPDRHIRLFPKDQAHWEGEVHEQLKTKEPMPVYELKGLVHHYSYYTIDEHRKRIETYSSLGAEQILRKGKLVLWPSILINPIARFLKCYLLKLGFLDGFYGLVIAALSAKAVFLKYLKAYKAGKRA